MENKIALQTKGIQKSFNGIHVLKGVDLDIYAGEVHALMGENGAGKSTIIKIITGVYEKDDGELYIEGKPVMIRNRADATANGISVIYQELSLIPALTVAENICLGHEPTTHGLLRQKNMVQQVTALIEEYGFDLKATTRVENLGMAKRQMVEILKALSEDAKIIIMDEPTSALSAAESEILFDTISRLKARGTAILYVSHRLDEVYRIADRLTVMRDGFNVGVLTREEISPAKVTTLMIGHEVKQDRNYKKPVIHEEMCLEVKNLAYKNILKDVSFKAYGGEIVGISGLVGSGRTELIKCIYGLYRQDHGEVLLNGQPIPKSVSRNIKNGFGLVPEDRLNEGFAPIRSISANLAISSYDILSKGGFVSARAENSHVEKAIKDYDVRPPLKNLPIINLSGGNQQKVVLGRWLSRDMKVLLLDEPTAGVDVGVKDELYHYIWQLSETGAIILVVSSDLAEQTYLCDRILVMYDGKIFEEFSHEEATQTAVLTAASGVYVGEEKV